jgi:hypothetical protein
MRSISIAILFAVLLAANSATAQTSRAADDGFGQSPFEINNDPFEVAPTRPEAESGIPLSLDEGTTLNPKFFEGVRDNTLGLQYEDRRAYFAGLQLAASLPFEFLTTVAKDLQELRRSQVPRYKQRKPEDFPAFVDLFQNPDIYRGQAVTMRGHFRRLVSYDPGENPFGIERVYEGWLFTQDSQTNAAVFVFLEKPEGLPVGGDITEDVEITGYFVKMYGYDAQDTTRRAPLIVGNTVKWTPRPPFNPTPRIPIAVYVVVGVLTLLIAWAIWWNQYVQSMKRRAISRNYDVYPPGESLPPDNVEPQDS